METSEAQAAEVMVDLQAVEASGIPKGVFPEIAASDALNTGETGINLNLVSEDDFDYTTLNHISPPPYQFPHQINIQITYHSLSMNLLMFRIS